MYSDDRLRYVTKRASWTWIITSVIETRRITSQHIGAAGELLTQYQLLKLGIDSARLTTDSGIDLVAYPTKTSSARLIDRLEGHGAGDGGGGAAGLWSPLKCNRERGT